MSGIGERGVASGTADIAIVINRDVFARTWKNQDKYSSGCN